MTKVKPKLTPLDERTLSEAQIECLQCPECGRMLIRPLGGKSVADTHGWICQVLGHTGLIADGQLQEKFLALTPRIIREHNPTWGDQRWKYAVKRGGECWLDDETLARQAELAKKRKGRKP